MLALAEADAAFPRLRQRTKRLCFRHQPPKPIDVHEVRSGCGWCSCFYTPRVAFTRPGFSDSRFPDWQASWLKIPDFQIDKPQNSRFQISRFARPNFLEIPDSRFARPQFPDSRVASTNKVNRVQVSRFRISGYLETEGVQMWKSGNLCPAESRKTGNPRDCKPADEALGAGPGEHICFIFVSILYYIVFIYVCIYIYAFI